MTSDTAIKWFLRGYVVLIFAFIFPLQCTRNVGAGLLMVRRRTLLISYGTGVRVLSLGVLMRYRGALTNRELAPLM